MFSNKYTCRIWSFKSWLRVRHQVTNSGATFEAPDPAGVVVTKHSSLVSEWEVDRAIEVTEKCAVYEFKKLA